MPASDAASDAAPSLPVYSSVVPVAKTNCANPLGTTALSLDSFQSHPPQTLATRPINGGVSGFVATSALSIDECTALVAQTEKAGYTFWHPTDTPAKRAFRAADTVEVHSPELADILWSRLGQYVAPRVRLVDEDEGDGDADGDAEESDDRGAEGTWVAYGVNPDMLFARYDEGGHFAPHTDGSAVVNFNDRSLYSLLVYLTTTGGGGGTRIVRPGNEAGIGTGALATDDLGRFRHTLGDDAYVDCCPCVAGNAMAFRQTAYHEGEPVEVGGKTKYIIRTDIMFRRVPPICAETPEDLKAFEFYREANQLEASGDAEEACKLYQRVTKLSPQLAAKLKV